MFVAAPAVPSRGISNLGPDFQSTWSQFLKTFFCFVADADAEADADTDADADADADAEDKLSQ